ncbi:glucoamylase family protein [Silvibacterium acidisoli]|uniref:glucoamylase family protein n=1 Tax=Acidobacteriaceae bacterium ZG23-2 TaxID=2883246 RepID=UPI00406CDC97
MTYQVPEIDQKILDAAGLTPDELRAQAREVTPRWAIAHRPKGDTAFTKDIDETLADLDELYAFLDAQPPAEVLDKDVFLELKENPRLLRAAISEVSSSEREIKKLPRVVAQEGEIPRVAVLSAAYLDAAKNVWNGSAQRIYLEAAQEADPLELKELWVLPSLMKFELVKRIIAQANDLRDNPEKQERLKTELKQAFRWSNPPVKSLRELSHADWPALMEPLVIFTNVLKQDPAGAYPRMDFDSREAYRKRVAEIAHYSEFTELKVAQEAVHLAREAQQHAIEPPRLYLRQAHVGYYLVDQGFEQLSQRIGYRPRFIDRIRRGLRRNADDFYIGGIEILSVLLIAAFLLPLIPNYPLFGGLTVAFILLLLPVTQGAVDLINNTISLVYRPTSLPKLDFSEGIPEEFTTLVTVPTLLMNEKQVRELVNELEVRFLANPDPHLHYALLTDLPDAVTRPRQLDSDPLVDLAVKLIDDLNKRYPKSPKHGGFFLLHRHRIFNARQGVWMGWERKRGKLLDLNKYLVGEFDAFPVKAGNMDDLHRVKYIITLDSDTQLPRGTAGAMIGTMAHPLNRAIIDKDRRIVTAGYGILQPRVGVSVHSASRSRLAAIYSGQTGFDIYTRAVSDTYQDLYGEGSFTGKGIYEVSALHEVLDKRFPRNSLLSHDLIEGAYARAGLVTDVEVIDDYPSHYSAYTRRKHRWVRGDWQIVQWLFSRVPDESGRFVRNPISTISRWKILDNLRRSLVEPLTLILLVSGWLSLPGGALYWTLITLFLMYVPTFVQLAFSLGRAYFAEEQPGAVRDSLLGFWQSLVISTLNLVYLPHQTMLSVDAILRAWIRRLITGQRLLEWETAAEAEASVSSGKVTAVDRYLSATPIFALCLAIVIAIFRRDSLLVAAPILVLWGCARGITLWLNSPPREVKQKLDQGERDYLRQHALRIWRFFYEFGGKRHNYLIPDNVEEKNIFEAARISPTNFGLLLNARQAAVAMGFLTVPEFTELSHLSFATIDRLEKYRGHVYNWYNTHTLEPLLPATISSVDNGNLAASLYTLYTGTAMLLTQPLLSKNLFAGLATHLQLLKAQKNAPADLLALKIPGESASLIELCTWAYETAQLDVIDSIPLYDEPSPDESLWWSNQIRTRLKAIAAIMHDYMPWLLPEYATLRSMQQIALTDKDAFPKLEKLADFATQLEGRLGRAWSTLSSKEEGLSDGTLAEKLRSELPEAREKATALATSVHDASETAYRLADDMDFGFLVQKGRNLLSIGYEIATHTLHEAIYDMLASEARIATFIAVAKGELSQQGWFKMGRTHVTAYDQSVLLSWTGTMFEYLMPALWMRSYPDTLISRTLHGVVKIQRDYAKDLGIPWGISESGYSKTTDDGHYHYQAFGIPPIALKWDATAGPVVSPYSTLLALQVDSVEALRNMHRMEQMGWTGAYGFYEAADYMESTKEPVLTREWMAHHQGMGLMAILNLLENDLTHTWFHANPLFQATELLLHEKPIREATLKAEQKKFAPKKRPARKKAS